MLQRVDGIALDSKGNLYMADQNWLRRLSPDGQVVTLNPKGGSGGFGPGLECPLESLKMNRIMGAGQLACDENDNVLAGDKWNGTWLRIDVAAGKVTILAGGPARGQRGFRDGSPGKDGPGNTEAIFHTGGGPSGLAHDRLTKRIYTYTADDHAVRAIMPDGMVKTLGPWTGRGKGHMAEGPMKDTQGYAGLAGRDLQGRVYVGNRDELMYRFYRKPAIEGAPAPKTPNPLLPWPKREAAKAGDLSVTLESPAADANALIAGPPALPSGAASSGKLPDSMSARIGDKTHSLLLDQSRLIVSKSKGVNVRTESASKSGEVPRTAIKGELWDIQRNTGRMNVDIADAGSNPIVAYDGQQFVVAYQHGSSVYAKRVSLDGKLLDAEPIKLGGQWEYCPAIASNGEVVVVTGAGRPEWNPWGWNGPGTMSIGRVTRDGKTPERFSVGSDALADGGFAGLLDRAQWKGCKGWPAGIPGGFKTTQNGYWPGRYSAVCWDGKTWVAAWVRTKIANGDQGIFACRVDPATMMPIGEPVLAAGGDAEPGTQTQPALVGLGDGTSVLVYLAVQPDRRVLPAARVLAGGSLTGPARMEGKK